MSNSEIYSSGISLKGEMRSAGRQGLIYAGGRVLGRLGPFIMLPFYTRLIDPSNYGVQELIYIVCAILELILMVGVDTSMVKFYHSESSAENQKVVISTILIVLGLFSLPLVAALIVMSPYFLPLISPDTTHLIALRLAIASIWCGLLFNCSLTYLRILYRPFMFVGVNFIYFIFGVSLNLYFVAVLNLDIIGIFYTSFIRTSLFGFGLCVWILRCVGIRVSFALFRRMLKYGLPLVPARIGMYLTFVTTRFFILYLLPVGASIALAQVSLYSIGSKLALLIDQFLVIPFMSFWQPRCFELLIHKGDDQAREIVARMATYVTVLTMFAALLLANVVEPVTKVLLGSDYQGCHKVVPILALAIVLSTLTKQLEIALLVPGRTVKVAKINLGAFSVAVVGNWALIPRYGIVGAASAVAAAAGFRAAFTYMASKRAYPMPFELVRWAKAGLTAILIYFLARSIPIEGTVQTCMVRIAITFCFPALLFLLGFFHKSEIAVLKGDIAGPVLSWFKEATARVK